MTPNRAHESDIREDIAGLATRASLTAALPRVLEEDGTGSCNQRIDLPSENIMLALARLPFRELAGPASRELGAAIGGTRECNLAPYLTEDCGIAFTDPHAYIHSPTDVEQIRQWMRDITGYGRAEAAFLRVAGWDINWPAFFLHRLYAGGLMAELIVAERQAAAALDAVRTVHVDKKSNTPLIESSGAILLGRALADMLWAFDRCIEEGRRSETSDSKTLRDLAATQEVCIQRLRSFARALRDCQRAKGPVAPRKKLGKAVAEADALIKALALFTVAEEPVSQRVIRVREALDKGAGRKARRLERSFPESIAGIADTIETLASASQHDLYRRTSWCPLVTGNLARLDNADAGIRFRLMQQVRTDLIYKLITTRRLDAVFNTLPWMSAPSGAFPKTYGGPLGAVAALFEAARAREIALELSERLYDEPERTVLDTRLGKRVYANADETRRALTSQTRAAFHLATSAFSYAMVQGFANGVQLDPRHPLPMLTAGSLDYDYAASMQNPQTLTSVTKIELGQSLYASREYRRDLPRYMGDPIEDLLAGAICAIFPGLGRGAAFYKFIKQANERRATLKQGATSDQDLDCATLELLHSVLGSLGRDDFELRKFDARSTRHIPANAGQTGESLRKRASDRYKARGRPAGHLQDLIQSALKERNVSPEEKTAGRKLAGILHGRSYLPSITPCAQEFVPALWFRPQIDAHLLTWIANGAAPACAPVPHKPGHAAAVAADVRKIVAHMPALFGHKIDPSLRVRILVPLFTGLAQITADLAHVVPPRRPKVVPSSNGNDQKGNHE